MIGANIYYVREVTLRKENDVGRHTQYMIISSGEEALPSVVSTPVWAGVLTVSSHWRVLSSLALVLIKSIVSAS